MQHILFTSTPEGGLRPSMLWRWMEGREGDGIGMQAQLDAERAERRPTCTRGKGVGHSQR